MTDIIKITTGSKNITLSSGERSNVDFTVNIPDGYKILTFVPITSDAAFQVSYNGRYSVPSEGTICISVYNCYSSNVSAYVGYDAICIKKN